MAPAIEGSGGVGQVESGSRRERMLVGERERLEADMAERMQAFSAQVPHAPTHGDMEGGGG